MPLLTTTIGSYPKPDYVTVPDWFQFATGKRSSMPTEHWSHALDELGDDAEAIFARGTQEVIDDQVACGIDIPTDGEVRREDYINYHCRHLEGIDFDSLAEKAARGGAYTARLPRIIATVRAKGSFLASEWRLAQSFTDRPVKATLPGPLTITDTTVDQHYDDPARLGRDLATALNVEVRALVDAGCRQIQIDEPVFARRPHDALDFGMENLQRVIDGCPAHVTTTVHMCCGYPDRLDNPHFAKAPASSYGRLAAMLEESSYDAISIEDAHRHNDLALLEQFPTKTIVFGAVTVASTEVETSEAIRTRLSDALQHIDASRLVAAPDCGLAMLPRDLALAKLRNLCAAAHSLP